MDALDCIIARRSIGRLAEPAPSPEHLRTMLEAASCAPDHGELRPWKFVVLEGESLDGFGNVLAEAYVERCADEGQEPMEAKREAERTKLRRAPMVVVSCAVHRPSDKIPWSEQLSSAAAATQNLLLAATALGYGSMWRTGEPAYDSFVRKALGLSDDDAVIGFVYLGTINEEKAKPPHLAATDGVVEHWSPS